MFRKVLETLKNDTSRISVACVINLLAVATVFMTQSIFLEISESFGIDITQAGLSFSVTSLSYSLSFLLLGPVSDRYNRSGLAVTGRVVSRE